MPDTREQMVELCMSQLMTLLFTLKVLEHAYLNRSLGFAGQLGNMLQLKGLNTSVSSCQLSEKACIGGTCICASKLRAGQLDAEQLAWITLT